MQADQATARVLSLVRDWADGDPYEMFYRPTRRLRTDSRASLEYIAARSSCGECRAVPTVVPDPDDPGYLTLHQQHAAGCGVAAWGET